MQAVTGIIYEYYFICRRKMWYYAHGIAMESGNENVQIGKLIDENSYGREQKHILIDDMVNLDFFKDNTVFEVKKTSAQMQGTYAQLKYYLYILKNHGVENITGEVRVPKENLIQKVELTNEDCIEIEENLAKIKKIIATELPPEEAKKSICKNCAYCELCFI